MPIEPIEEKDLDLEGKFKREGGLPPKPEVGPEKITEPEKETAAEISASEKDSAYNKILSKVKKTTQSAVDPNAISSDADAVYQKTDSVSQIQHLVDLALEKGVIHAVKVARHLEDNYVLDMFHDRLLADELHDALVKKGIIKEI